MKLIKSDDIYRIYSDNLKTYDKLPAGIYNVEFSKFMGMYLREHDDIHVTEKLYGPHESKVNKILNTFGKVTRNLGVIFSGAKGIGKSLSAKLLTEKAVALGYPVLLINEYLPNIPSFLDSIEQEVVVLFDEFDKTFSQIDGQPDPQNELLTLFDGMSQGKKLFVVTCNRICDLNEYLVNRPGRFHYHLRFSYPSSQEVREYMEDNVDKEYHSEIDKVVEFAGKVEINYDSLRAIAFELNLGYSFEEAIADLNIVNIKREEYTVSIVFSDNTTYVCRNHYLDMFASDDSRIWAYHKPTNAEVAVSFNTEDAKYSVEAQGYIIPKDHLELEWSDGNDNSVKKKIKDKLIDINCVVIKRKYEQDIHYSV